VAARNGLALRSACLAVGTDCSGAEAPILALRALGVPHRHVFSCEKSPKIREYIAANFAGAVIFDDMLTRDHRALPAHNVYVCGFPCKPFSALRHRSRLLRERDARPFFAMFSTLRQALPQLAILENVLGIRRVMAKVWRRIRELRWYEALTFLIDPSDLGEPVRRPRYYFVLIRSDVAVARGNDLGCLAGKLAEAGLKPAGGGSTLPSTLAHRVAVRPVLVVLVGVSGRAHRWQRPRRRCRDARRRTGRAWSAMGGQTCCAPRC
jgi:site-specific DNA-cytosine methylase